MILSLLPNGQFPDEMMEDAFSRCPEQWDDDASAEDILLAYIHHLEDEVQRLGGCLKPYCGLRDEPPEPCDHGWPQ